MIRRLLAFGDDFGIPMLLRHLEHDVVVGIVAASIRPAQHDFLAGCAHSLRVPFLVQPKRDSPDYPAFAGRVRALAPDFIMVNSYSMLIGADILQAAPLGGVNIHGALLPRFRGANPIQWALIEDQRETGVTMHALTEDIDAGPIVAQRKVPILFQDTWREIHARIGRATEILLSESLPDVLSGKACGAQQDPAQARYLRRRNAEDGKIDWAKPVLDAYNLIRALVEPHPGAYYETREGPVWIRQCMPIQAVAALKYSVLAEPAIIVGDARFWPSPLSTGQEESTFSLECGTGKVLLKRIDWQARQAALQVEMLDAQLKDDAAALERAAAEFARSQLGLRVVSR